MKIVTATEYIARLPKIFQLHKKMFIELTEIIMDRLMTYASQPKERPISINVDKIQAFHTEASTKNCIIETRKESIKVKETYEEVKNAIQKN